jgi:uncharacterized membrane protein
MSAKQAERELFGAPKSLAWMLILGGITGWAAAFVLTLDRIRVASNPDAALSCDINPFISCKSVMLTWQAKIFGFPNPLIGIAAFMAPIVVGFALLAGAKFAKWFWQLFTIGIALGFIFVLWLFSQAVFDIGVLCPYCMVAWAGMIPIFWQQFLYVASEGIIPVPIRTVRFFVAAYEWHWMATFFTVLVVLATIAWRFWDVWPTVF